LAGIWKGSHIEDDLIKAAKKSMFPFESWAWFIQLIRGEQLKVKS
jgi:hypothetical protein